jgi:hypothetical protein
MRSNASLQDNAAPYDEQPPVTEQIPDAALGADATAQMAAALALRKAAPNKPPDGWHDSGMPTAVYEWSLQARQFAAQWVKGKTHLGNECTMTAWQNTRYYWLVRPSVLAMPCKHIHKQYAQPISTGCHCTYEVYQVAVYSIWQSIFVGNDQRIVPYCTGAMTCLCIVCSIMRRQRDTARMGW